MRRHPRIIDDKPRETANARINALAREALDAVIVTRQNPIEDVRDWIHVGRPVEPPAPPG